jgi:hypothetical protein
MFFFSIQAQNRAILKKLVNVSDTPVIQIISIHARIRAIFKK